MLLKENEELRIANASLTTENSVLKQRVGYFETLVANQTLKPCSETAFAEPELVDKDEHPHVEDNDYAFAGTFGREEGQSPGAFLFTFIFAVLCLVSIFIGNGTSSMSETPGASGGRGLKTQGEREWGWQLLVLWTLNPYFLLVVSMVVMCAWMLRGWTRHLHAFLHFNLTAIHAKGQNK